MKRAVVIAASVILVAGVALVLLLGPKPVISRTIIKQAGFGVWYPAKPYEVRKSTLKVTKSGQDMLASFDAANGGTTLSFTEQATPESFTDVPQVYDKLIEKLRGYSTFDSVNGKVDLTMPEELKGVQTAVMNSRGTLIFVRPSKALSANDWRQVFNSLQLAH